MIRYGAEQVLSSSAKGKSAGSDLVDIEAILAKGEERTKELQERYRNAGFEDLLSANGQSGSLYEWEGEDFATSSGPSAAGGHKWIELAKRERKATYSVDYYYREALRVHPKKDRPAKAPVPKSCIIHDHQLFPEAIKPLLEKEIRHHQRTVGYKLTEADVEDAKERAAQQRLIDTATPLTAKEQRTRDDLFSQGFPDWSKKDFLAFIRGCERFGRKDLEAVAEQVEKPIDQVRKYSRAFWQRLDSLPDGDKIMAAIEKGEGRLAKAEQTHRMLCDYVRGNPASQPLSVASSDRVKSRNYSPDEDDAILRSLVEHGYGNDAAYTAVQSRARTDPVFRFDWFLRTRTVGDLAHRAQKLVALVEREMKARDKARESASAASMASSKKRKASNAEAVGKSRRK
jgi:SWI/SNF-related matrix-associated actin-dependent regulator of chromatin subfamily A member 5